MLMAQISDKAVEADGLGESDQARLGLTLARLRLEERRCLGKGNRIARFQLLAPPRLRALRREKRLGARLRKGVDGWLAAARWP